MGLGVLDIVGKSVNILFSNKSIIISAFIAALLIGALYIILLLLGMFNLASLIITAVLLIEIALAVVFFQGMVINATNARNGAGFGLLINKTLSRYLVLLRTDILILVIVGFVIMLLVFLSLFAWAVHLAGTIPLLVLFIVLANIGLISVAYLGTRLILAPMACILGGSGVIASLTSSWTMTKGSLFDLIAISLLVDVVIVFISIIFAIIVVFASSASTIINAVNAFISAFLGYAALIAFTLVYQKLSDPSYQRTPTTKLVKALVILVFILSVLAVALCVLLLFGTIAFPRPGILPLSTTNSASASSTTTFVSSSTSSSTATPGTACTASPGFLCPNGFAPYADDPSVYKFFNITTNQTGATYSELYGMPYTYNYGIYKAFNISNGTKSITVSYSTRMTSGSAYSSVTNMRVTVTDAATNKTLATSVIVSGGTMDTGWQQGSTSPINVSGLGRINVEFIIHNAWAAYWMQKGYVNNINVVKLS